MLSLNYPTLSQVQGVVGGDNVVLNFFASLDYITAGANLSVHVNFLIDLTTFTAGSGSKLYLRTDIPAATSIPTDTYGGTAATNVIFVLDVDAHAGVLYEASYEVSIAFPAVPGAYTPKNIHGFVLAFKDVSVDPAPTIYNFNMQMTGAE